MMDRVKWILRPSANGGMSLKGHTLTIWKQIEMRFARNYWEIREVAKTGCFEPRDV